METENYQQQIADLGAKYWEGKENALIRQFVYVNRGVNVINNFKYLGAFVIWLYYALHLHALFLIPLMGLAAMPFLSIIGRYDLQKVSKTTEYIQMIMGSILGFAGFKLQVRSTEAVESIDKKLDVKLNQENQKTE